MNTPFAQFVILLLSACICICHGQEIEDIHSLQEAYAQVAAEVFPAVALVLNCLYDGQGQLVEAGVGSGFFVRDDGVLVTNHHVIEGAKVLGVKLLDGTVVPATILGDNAATDIAVLKAEVGKKVPFLKFADTSTVKVGHYAIAVGAPHRPRPKNPPSRWSRPTKAPQKLSHTMVTGMVSSKGRTLQVRFGIFDQKDANTDSSNNGGPLLNIDGLVIGVNDWGDFRSSGTSRFGFAIDGNLVQRTLGELLRRGLQARPSFGATIEERLDGQPGVLVTAVKRGSPAEQAGLKKGDVILRLGMTQVTDPLQLQAVLLTDYRPGDTAELEVLRDKTRQILTIRFGAVEK